MSKKQREAHSSKLIAHSLPGMMLLDVLLGITVFALFLGAVGMNLLYTQRTFLVTGDRARGVFLSEHALEAARSIRDQSFDMLTAGTHGVRIGIDGKWQFSGTGTTTNDGYRTSLLLENTATDTVRVTATTRWSVGLMGSGSVALVSELTNWRKVQQIGDWSTLTLRGTYTASGAPEFREVAVSGDYAFVTAEDSGNVGLYIFDISDQANPTRVASSFSLGATAWDIAIAGTTLYVLTTEAGAELQSYDISAPASLDTSDRLDTENIPGSGKGRSLALGTDVLFVGAAEDAIEKELYVYNVADPGAITQLDTLDGPGGILSLGLHEGYAYAASTQDIAELRVIDVFDPSDIADASGVGYNTTDVQDGQAIVVFGTGVLLGRVSGSAIEELILFDVAATAVPSPPPGPWYFEVGGSAEDIDAEIAGRYAFLASDHSTKELRVIVPDNLRAGASAEVSTYNAADAGRAVKYLPSIDRLIFVTTKTLQIFAPG